MRRRLAALLLRAALCAIPCAIPCTIAAAQETPGYAAMQAKRPDLFHPATGMRVARQRAPTPADIPPPAVAVGPQEARALIEGGAVAVDVGAAFIPRYDDLDGSWREPAPHLSIPGATWLPEVGRGELSSAVERWYADSLSRLTGGDRETPLVIFCIADCWMSWNAARRAAESFGYARVFWFRLGTDGWQDLGLPLAEIPPTPVAVD